MSGKGANLGGTGLKNVPFTRSSLSVSDSNGVSEKLVSVSCVDGTDWEEQLVSTHAIFGIWIGGLDMGCGSLISHVVESWL